MVLAVMLAAALLCPRSARNDGAVGIVGQRYARGEIDAGELERRGRRLGGRGRRTGRPRASWGARGGREVMQ